MDGRYKLPVGNESDNYGTCNYLTAFFVTQNTAATVLARYAELKAVGYGWHRRDFIWSEIEPTTKGTFNWSGYDDMVLLANQAGIKTLPILCYSVNWANGNAGNNMVPPINSQDYADFCAAVVNRYYPMGVTHYELWNEPNIDSFWQPSVNPAKYYEMAKLAYTAIKAVQPNAQVVFGCTTLDTLAENASNHVSANLFLQGAYDAGCKDYFDIFSHHPYGLFLNGRKATNCQENTMLALRDVMVANGDSHKKIWITEYGRPTGGQSNFSTEAQQADQFKNAIRYFRRFPGVEKVFIYRYDDQEAASSNTDREYHYGIQRFDGTKKPSYYAVRDTIREG